MLTFNLFIGYCYILILIHSETKKKKENRIVKRFISLSLFTVFICKFLIQILDVIFRQVIKRQKYYVVFSGEKHIFEKFSRQFQMWREKKMKNEKQKQKEKPADLWNKVYS